MICPNDSTQMVQKDKLGGGTSTDEEYTTSEIKECPKCKRLVLEFYTAKVLSKSEFKWIKKRGTLNWFF